MTPTVLGEFSVDYLSNLRHHGTLAIDTSSVRFFGPRVPPVVIPLSSVAGVFRSKETPQKPHVIMKIVESETIVTDPRHPGHNFEFTSSNKQADRDAAFTILKKNSPLLSTTAPPPPPPSEPTPQPSSSIHNQVSHEIVKRRAILEANPSTLGLLHRNLVAKGFLSEDLFWSRFSNYLRCDIGQSPAITSSLPGFFTSSSHSANKITFQLTQSEKESFFLEFPQLKELYFDLVHNSADESNFWVQYYEYRRQRLSMKLNVEELSDIAKKFFNAEKSRTVQNEAQKGNVTIDYSHEESVELWPFRENSRETGTLVEIVQKTGVDIEEDADINQEVIVKELNLHGKRVVSDLDKSQSESSLTAVDGVLIDKEETKWNLLPPTEDKVVESQELAQNDHVIKKFVESLENYKALGMNIDFTSCWNAIADVMKSIKSRDQRGIMSLELPENVVSQMATFQLCASEILRHFWSAKVKDRVKFEQVVLKYRSIIEEFIRSQPNSIIGVISVQLNSTINSLNKAIELIEDRKKV
ncbi:hypothetical protein P9112_011328 [Eukaryota sp. TZLM1-RC]